MTRSYQSEESVGGLLFSFKKAINYENDYDKALSILEQIESVKPGLIARKFIENNEKSGFLSLSDHAVSHIFNLLYIYRI